MRLLCVLFPDQLLEIGRPDNTLDADENKLTRKLLPSMASAFYFGVTSDVFNTGEVAKIF